MRSYFRGKISALKKVAKFPPGEIWGLWQCSVCLRQCKLWDLQGWRNCNPPKFSPAKYFPHEIIPPPVHGMVLLALMVHSGGVRQGPVPICPAVLVAVLSNINLSGAKYLATTSFANTSNPLMSQTSLQSLHAHNWTVMAPGRRGKRKKQTPIAVTRFDYFYRINLWAPPFRLGPALLEREERFIRHGHIPRFVALWRLPVPVPDLRGMDST